MAHKKAGGTAKNLRDSQPKMLGIKLFGEQFVRNGGIIARQRGYKYDLGENVMSGKDHTIHATIDGIVRFKKKYTRLFTGVLKKKTFIYVDEIKEENK